MVIRYRMEWVFEVTLIAGLVFFTAWLSHLTSKLTLGLGAIENSDEQLDDIRESVEIVAALLNRLPELLPQFNMPATNPLMPIFEAFARKLTGESPLMTYAPSQDSDGRFNGTQKEQDNPQTSGQTYVESDASP
jgi:hypothetical protein|tara:strand:- start:1583 stop:1984 length:402 start_codon:yes stop_codon:yes gene_type:complete